MAEHGKADANGWMDIASAPRGKRILTAGLRNGKWRQEVDWYREPKDGAGYIGFGEWNSTHWPALFWQLLPAPPTMPADTPAPQPETEKL